jgi:hypothetical protein
MNLAVIQETIRNDIKAVGISKMLFDVIYKAINHVVYLRVLACVVIEQPDPRFLQIPSTFECRFLNKTEIENFSNSPEYDLEVDTLKLAFRKGDECFAILDGDRLASYGWYSNHPTTSSEGLNLHFNLKYIYMYQGYTHHDYRGQRLHAIGMTMALNKYLQRGFKGIVSCVDATNFNSLKSVYRMGYRNFGKLYIFKALGQSLVYRTPGCKEYDYRLVKT